MQQTHKKTSSTIESEISCCSLASLLPFFFRHARPDEREFTSRVFGKLFVSLKKFSHTKSSSDDDYREIWRPQNCIIRSNILRKDVGDIGKCLRCTQTPAERPRHSSDAQLHFRRTCRVENLFGKDDEKNFEWRLVTSVAFWVHIVDSCRVKSTFPSSHQPSGLARVFWEFLWNALGLSRRLECLHF